MKKTLLLLAIALVPFTSANAKFIGSSDQAILTVAEVKGMKDDKPVMLKGSIEKHISKDKYQFIDSTGRIVVEIEGEDWRGLDVTPNDTVLIVGETEKEWFKDVYVDVSSIEKIKS